MRLAHLLGVGLGFWAVGLLRAIWGKTSAFDKKGSVGLLPRVV